MKLILELEEGEGSEFSQTVHIWDLTRSTVETPLRLATLIGDLADVIENNLHWMKD